MVASSAVLAQRQSFCHDPQNILTKYLKMIIQSAQAGPQKRQRRVLYQHGAQPHEGLEEKT